MELTKETEQLAAQLRRQLGGHDPVCQIIEAANELIALCPEACASKTSGCYAQLYAGGFRSINSLTVYFGTGYQFTVTNTDDLKAQIGATNPEQIRLECIKKLQAEIERLETGGAL